MMLHTTNTQIMPTMKAAKPSKTTPTNNNIHLVPRPFFRFFASNLILYRNCDLLILLLLSSALSLSNPFHPHLSEKNLIHILIIFHDNLNGNSRLNFYPSGKRIPSKRSLLGRHIGFPMDGRPKSATAPNSCQPKITVRKQELCDRV